MKRLLIFLGLTIGSVVNGLPPKIVICENESIEVKYNRGNETMPANLSIIDKSENINIATTLFEKDKTVFGSILSIITKGIPDSYTERLSIIIPRVNIIEDKNFVPFETRIIKSRSKTTIAGPSLVDGLIDEVIALSTLKCQAYPAEV